MDTSKICTTCGHEKPLTEYRFRNKKEGILQSSCKGCCSIQGKKHYEQNKQEVVRKTVARSSSYNLIYKEFKSTLQCAHCGENAPYCLDFHHVDDNSKSDELSDISRLSWNALKVELRKCVCVCSNCHRKIHAGDLTVDNEWIVSLNNHIDNFMPSL